MKFDPRLASLTALNGNLLFVVGMKVASAISDHVKASADAASEVVS